MEVVVARNKYWLFYFVLLVLEGVLCNTFYGKLVLKISVASKKNSVFAHRPTIFATRRSTYLKKDGDVFQIHIPGIARNSTADTISFESVRFPGYFLRHKKVEDDYRFRIAKPTVDDKYFNSEATFRIQRHSGIEGSGMLRLFEDPSYYLCVRKYNYADSALKAMKNDNTEDFRARCSFFIQKMKPENVNDAVKKSTQNDKNKQKLQISKQTNIKNVVRPFVASNMPPEIVGARKGQVSSKTGSNQRVSLTAGARVIPKTQVLPQYSGPARKAQASDKTQVASQVTSHREKGEPSEKVVRKMLDDYVKKIQTIPEYVSSQTVESNQPQQFVSNVIPQNLNPTTTMGSWNGKNKLNGQNVNFYPQTEQFDLAKSMYPQSNQGYQSQNLVYPGTSMLSYFPVVSKYDPTKQYIRTFFQEDDEHLPNPETNHPVEVGTESFQTDIKSDLKNKIHKSSTSTNTETSLGKEHTKYFKATPILSSSKVHAQNQRKLNRTTVVKETLHSKRRQQNATLIMKSKVKNVSTTMHSHQPVYSAAFRKQTTRHGAWRNKNGLSHRTADSRFKVKPASLLRLGPNKPINLHDFGKTTHREPSLNLDGLVAGVKLPLTRSNITVSSMDKDDTLDSNTITGGKNKTIHNWLKQTNSNTSLHEIQASNGNVSSQSKVAMINENQNSNGYKTNKMAASNNKEVLGFRKIEKEVNLLDSMDSKKGKIETALNKNSPIPLKNTTQLDTMRSVLENPSPDNTGTQIKKAEKQAPAAKKEHFVDETLKNFTTDASDLDLKIFGDEKNDSFAASEDKPIEAAPVNTTTSGENTNVDNSTSMSAFPDVKANSSDPIEKILYSAMTDDPTLKNINLTQPEDGGFTFGENKETKQNPEKHAKNDTTRMTVFDTANASTPAPERFLPPVTQTSLTKNNKTKNSTVPNDTKTATVNKTVATESGKLPEASNVTLGLANKTSVLAGNATSFTDKVPLVAEKVMKDNTSVANSTLLTQRNITLSVLKAHQNSTNLDNVTSVNDSISTVSLVNKSKDHQESTPTRTSIKEVKVMNNEETENEENSNAAMEQTSDTGDDNIPFEETTSNDVSNSDGTTEAGDNMDSATDNNEGSLATLLNQHNDGGIEYDNMDKATTFKDLGSSEMKGIAKAMSSLNIQDVDHLRSRMKTIDMIDRNPPNHFQHLKKAENDYANEGLHTNGIALGEQPDTAHVQSYTAEDKDVGDSPSAVHEENYADVLGGQTTNQQSPTVVNDNNMQLNGDAHETESTLQDPALQEASSVPVSISATAPEASTSAQESISTAQQMSTPTAQELSSAQESSMLQNEAQQSIDPSQTGGNALHVGGSNTDNMVSAGNNMVAQRDENAEGTGLNLGSQGGEASGVTMGTENELSSFTPQKQAEQGDNVGEMDNVNEQGSVVPQQDVNADSPDARSNLNKKHHRHPHPQKAVVVKGVAKNTVLKVPIAISYSKVHEEDNSGHHKLEHMIKDVIHDVKNELHGGGGDINEQQQGMFRHATLASNDILPHFSHVEEEHGPVVGSPRVEHHPVTLYETEHYEPAKSSSGIVTPESFQERPMMQHEVNVVRHTHHVVTVKDDSEKQKMVNGLVDYDSDRCVSLQLINDLPSRYRLISSINKHGYTPRGKVFTLKTVFKDPSAHKYVSFHAIDESEPSKQVTLDGAKELISVPTPCQSKPKVVHVAGVQTKPSIVSKKDILPDVIPEVGTDETHVEKKNRIAYPLQEHFIVHNLNGLHKRQHITHIYLKKAKKDRISYPRQMRRFNVMRDSVTSPCIRTYGGSTHSSVECCHLPYIYNGRVHSTCLSDGPNSQPWCSLTRDFDQDKRWGLCMTPTIPEPEESQYRAPMYWQ